MHATVFILTSLAGLSLGTLLVITDCRSVRPRRTRPGVRHGPSEDGENGDDKGDGGRRNDEPK